ncbi:MAG TPA: hypothetical protein VJA94_22360 [Candidatus Angelobacter sp.]
MKTLQTLLIVLLLSLFATAQNKISGTVKCGKPDQFQKVDVGDKPGHALAISQGKCTWTKPVNIGGAQTKDDVGTDSLDITPSGAEAHGYVVGTLTSGDKIYVHTQGKDTNKDGKLESTTGTWSFTGGSGKAEGIKGGGTFTGKPDADGNVIIEVKGQYTLPKKK